MKTRINYITTALVIAGLLAVSSCQHHKDPEPEEVFDNKVSKTWIVGSVIEDGKDVTDTFTNFSLTFTSDKKYTSMNNPLKAGTFAESGTFEPLASAGSPDLFDVQLDNTTTLAVSALSETQLKFTLQYKGTGARTSSISGNYLFTLLAK